MERELLLDDAFRNIEIELNNQQIKMFLGYYDAIIEKNKSMNLTAITDYREAVYKHFIDSIMLKKAINLEKKLSLIDVGTGAGFPSIPLKICFQDLNCLLLDSLNKRTIFLDEIINDLGLSSIETIHGRAEDIAKDDKYREQFDVSVSRAVSKLAVLSEYCLPFVKVGGYFIAYKSGNYEEELNNAKAAINKLGGSLEKVFEYEIPEIESTRTLILIKKIQLTPKIYPRIAGTPKKEPIMR